MAKIIENSPAQKEWTALIRCASPVCFGTHRVDGCFSIIEITLNDIQARCDYEGDWSFWCNCPSCNQTLYPKWQIGEAPLNVIVRQINEKKREYLTK